MMPATLAELRSWLEPVFEPSAHLTHMIIKCDSFEHEDCCYPVYVEEGQDPREIAIQHSDRTVEVYSRNVPKEDQLKPHQYVMNFD
jgi:hypothetical protein